MAQAQSRDTVQQPGGKSLVLRPGEVVLAKMTNFLLSSVSEASVLSQQ